MNFFKSYIALIYFFALASFSSVRSQTVQWANTAGRNANDVAVDAKGNVYSVGDFNALTDFDPGPGQVLGTSAGSSDMFVLKQDPLGKLLWARTVGGPGTDVAIQVVVDPDGAVVVVGRFSDSVDFDPGSGIQQIKSLSSQDGFVWKLDSAGNFVWLRSAAGNGSETINSISCDAGGSLNMVGSFFDKLYFTSGALTSASLQTTSPGAYSIFLWRLTTSGNFVWAKKISSAGGPTNKFFSYDMIADLSGNLIITGCYNGAMDFDPGPSTYTLGNSTGGFDSFILKLDSLGNFVHVNRIGGTMDQVGTCLGTDQSGNIYAAGDFNSQFEMNPGSGTFSMSAQQAMYLVKLGQNGNFLWAKKIEGAVAPVDMVINTSNEIIFTGLFSDTVVFDPSLATTSVVSRGHYDTYIHKVDSSGKFMYVYSYGDVNFDQGLAIDVRNNEIYLSGIFSSSIKFYNSSAVLTLNAAGAGFVLKVADPVTITGLVDLPTYDYIRAYPVPATDLLNIPGNKTQKFSLTDESGKLIWEEKLVLPARVNMAGLPRGLYYLRNQESEQTLRIVKE